MKTPVEKKSKRYLFNFVYCVVVVAIWNYVGIFVLAFEKNNNDLDYIPFIMMPFVIPAIFMVFNLAVFPFKYGCFGKYERTPSPNEKPIYAIASTSGRIGIFQGTMPFFSYKVFSSGFEISILGVGKAFIFFHDFKEIKGGFLGYKIKHKSPEVRNTIALPNKEIFEVVKKQHEKNLSTA